MSRNDAALSSVDHPNDIRPEWLTTVLARNGIEAEVRSFATTPVGTGQMADNFRLAIEYASREAAAPDSLVIKVPSANATSRASGGSGAYQTEFRFYTELANDVAIRVPACYYGDISDEGDSFILVLEDLAPAEQGDQILGCTPEEAELAIVNLAGLHGSQWCNPELDRFEWLNRTTADVAKLFSGFMQHQTGEFIERYRARMSDEDRDVLRLFAERSGDWLIARPDIFAPVHGDYRLDNLLFGTAAGGAPVAAVDWQTLAIGNPGRDTAYFLGNSLEPELRREHEKRLLARYHEGLVEQGVAGYELDACYEDYRFGHFQGTLVTVLGAMAVIQTDRGDDMFMAMCSRSCQAIRDLDSASFL